LAVGAWASAHSLEIDVGFVDPADKAAEVLLGA
jgi:hypothetical protein